MAKKSLLDSIDVPAPCPKKWDEMIGDDKIRLCQSCDKNIYNISEMTRSEARKLLFQSKEKVCIRLEKDGNGRVQTLKKQFHKITRQAPIAAGVLSASLTFSALTYAQGEPVVGKVKPSVSKNHQDKTFAASISGVVSDANGAVIPGATVTLRGTKNNSTRNTKSNDDGFYEFRDVEESTYEIEAVWINFKKSVSASFTAEEGANLQMNIVLEPSAPPTDQNLVFDDSQTVVIEPAQINNSVERQKLESLPAQRNLLVLGLFPGTKPAPAKNAASKNQNKTSQISFTIYDATGAVVPNITVKLTNQKTKKEFTVLSNEQGVAQFSLIPHGRYDLLITSSIGLQDYRQTVQIKESIEPNIKIELNTRFTTGVYVVNSSEIPLFQAVSQEDNEAVKQLVNSGFDVNTKDSYGKTALHIAVEYSNLEIVRFLLDNGAKVNIKSKSKRTALLMIDESVRDEDDKFVTDIVRLLITKGADVDAQDDEKETALMMAGGEGNLEVTKILLEAGANPNLKDKDGDTVFSTTPSDEIKQLLKRYGARE